MTTTRLVRRWINSNQPLRLRLAASIAAMISTLIIAACSQTSAAVLAPEHIDTPSLAPVSPEDIEIDGDSTWREVFDQLNATEQSCIRDELGDSLEAALERSLVHLEALSEPWEESLYGCLERETARLILLTVRAELVSRLPEGALEIDEQQARSTDDYGDTISEATALVDGESVAGRLGHEFDVDVFSFAATEAAFYVIDVGLGTLSDSVVYLLNTHGERIAYNNDYRQARASRIYWHAPASEDYYVVVGSPSRMGRGSYALTMAEIRYPDDHPNTRGGATPLIFGEVKSGVVDYRHDVDAFRFDAEEGAIYEIEAEWGTLSLAYIHVQTEGGRDQVSGMTDSDARRSRIVWMAPASGRYNVIVEGRGTGTYTLTARVSDVVDDYPGTPAEASRLAVGGSLSGAVDYQGDVDMFAFDSEAGRYYEIDLALETLSGWIAAVGTELDHKATFAYWYTAEASLTRGLSGGRGLR